MKFEKNKKKKVKKTKKIISLMTWTKKVNWIERGIRRRLKREWLGNENVQVSSSSSSFECFSYLWGNKSGEKVNKLCFQTWIGTDLDKAKKQNSCSLLSFVFSSISSSFCCSKKRKKRNKIISQVNRRSAKCAWKDLRLSPSVESLFVALRCDRAINLFFYVNKKKRARQTPRPNRYPT